MLQFKKDAIAPLQEVVRQRSRAKPRHRWQPAGTLEGRARSKATFWRCLEVGPMLGAEEIARASQGAPRARPRSATS